MDTEDLRTTTVENEELVPFFLPIYIELLESLCFINSPQEATPPEPEDLQLAEAVIKIIDPSISDDTLPSHKILNVVRFATLTCRKHPPKAQLAMAHYVTLLTIIDDAVTKEGDKFLRDMEMFQVKMCNPDGYSRLFPGNGPLHPLLENLITFLTTDFCPFFLKHPILNNILIKATLDFIVACQLEVLHSGKHGSKLEATSEIQQYPAFLWVKSGIAEGFSLLLLCPLADDEDSDFFYNKIFPVLADLNDFWVNLNDLLSLYKELKEGDLLNGILLNAKVYNTSLSDAIRQVVAHSVEVHKRVMSVADRSGSSRFKDYMVQMYQGYFVWHLGFADRYHLDEVLGK
jgi:hypothetical protein